MKGMPTLGFLVFSLDGVLLDMEVGVVGSPCCTLKLFGVLLCCPPKSREPHSHPSLQKAKTREELGYVLD